MGKEEVIVHFRLIKEFRDFEDETVFISGSLEELGNWSTDHAQPMIYLKPGLWTYAVVLDKECFDACKSMLQFTFFIAKDHTEYGRSILKMWNPYPSRYEEKQQEKFNEVIIESNWNEAAPTLSNDIPVPKYPEIQVSESLLSSIPVYNQEDFASPKFSQRIVRPFSWYPEDIKKEMENVFKAKEPLEKSLESVSAPTIVKSH